MEELETLLRALRSPARWEAFYAYKAGLAVPKTFTRDLRAFIDEKRYLPICDSVARGDAFPLPRRAEISKQGTDKKRVVYKYPADQTTALKLLTHLTLRRYDGLFAPGLYSFRPGRTAKDAVRSLLKRPGVFGMYAFKTDVHDYFNSIPVEKLVPMLETALADDPALAAFYVRLLTEPRVLDGDRVIAERKGIMAGTPPSAFFANLYLSALDAHFAALGAPYARYSDDIILFAESREALDAHASFVTAFLADHGLALNPEKTEMRAPGEPWTFLGFVCREGVVDVSPAAVTKLKGKMRRKTRALARWAKRNGVSGEKAAKAFLRIFNRKLFEQAGDNELTWTAWYFPVISTADSLRVIDRYAQDCVRYLVSGTRTKSRFNVRYEDLKRLGYRSLVHAYYAGRDDSGQATGAGCNNAPDML